VRVCVCLYLIIIIMGDTCHNLINSADVAFDDFYFYFYLKKKKPTGSQRFQSWSF